MEVGDEGVGHRELIRREDELVGPAVEGADLFLGRDVGLEGAGHRHADGEDLVAARLGAVDRGGGLLGDRELLGVHLVLGEVFHVHVVEMGVAHIEGQEGGVDVADLHFLEEDLAEVQAGRRAGHGTLLRREDGLEALFVNLFRVGADPLGNGQGAHLVEGLAEFLVGTVEEEAERAAAGGRVVDDLGHQAVVLTEIELVADADLAGGIDQHVPEALVAVELAQQEDVDLGAGLFLVAAHPGGEHFGVVEHEQVVRRGVLDDILENPVLDFAGVLVQHHQAAFVPLGGRVFGDQFRGKFKSELGKFHFLDLMRENNSYTEKI